MFKKQKGFTLIELLVVIAIIGILSAVVLTALSNARDKGNDAKVKATLAAARARAELYSTNNNNSYGITVNGSCATAGSMFVDTSSGMSATLGGLPSVSTATCFSSASAYAISATLPGAGGTNSWCVDSTGDSQPRGTAITSTAC